VIPSTIVTNDWGTGLVAAYAKKGFFGDTFNGTKFMHICHNLDPVYEGRIFNPHLGHIHELQHDLLVDPHWSMQCINPSRCALICSDNWGTVSPSYKNELLASSALAHLLRNYPQSFAHPNGIPVAPRLKKLSVESLGVSSHAEAKEVVQRRYFNFEQGDPSIPLFVFVGRITSQKGVKLITDMAESIIRKYHHKVQILVGGMRNQGERYSDEVCHHLVRLKNSFPYNFWAEPDW
jgi:starch synthase